MKKLTIACCMAAILFAACSENKSATDTKKEEPSTTTSSATNSENKSEAWVPVDSATMEKAWKENMTPGKEHANLAKSNGTWDAEMTMWMAPDAPPMTNKGVSMNKMILGGRYQESNYKGNFMGEAFEGTGLTGYDNTKKVYTTTWRDNMSTTPMNMEGTWDEATKSVSFKGKMVCSANGKEMEMREVYKIIDENNEMMEMYGPDMKTGKEYKSMQIKFTRKK